MDEFKKDKIVWIELTDRPKFALDTKGYLLNNTIFFITGSSLRYLTGFLNSAVCEWYLDKIAATSGVGTRRWFKVYVEQIYVPIMPTVQQNKISSFVEEMLLDTITETRKHELKNMIDKEIFKFCGLTNDEAQFVTSCQTD